MADHETLQNSIEVLQKNHQLKERRQLKLIMKVVKHFAEYVKDTDTLPPDTLIPCCLFVLPQRFCQLLNIQQDQPLDLQPQKKGIDLALQTYLKSLCKLLEKCDQQIKHVVIEGINKAILLTVPYPKIAKKWLKQLITIWSSQSMNINLGLRAFISINKYLHVINEETLMWTLRRMYVAYFENSKQISWRNLEHINFMTNCYCELSKINESRSYYVLFGYVRSIALQMANLNKSKRKEKVELINKLYSNQVLNCFRLFTAVVSRVNSEEMSALVYPLIQLTVAYQKVSQANEFVPLKLHLLTNLLSIMETTGVYIPPVIEMFQKLLKNKIFSKKLGKNVQKMGGDLQLSYKLSPSDLTNTNFINQIFETIIYKVYWFASITQKLAAGSQILKKIANMFKSLQFPFSGYKQQVSQIIKLLKTDSYEHFKIRASKHMSVVEKKGIEIVEKQLETKEFEMGQKFEQVKEERDELLKKKLLAENEEDGEGGDNDQQQALEEDDELNSGWQQAEEGASQFDQKEAQEREDEEDDEEDEQQMDEEDNEKVSYEGDPDEEQAEEAIKQWSQEEWSSQQQMGPKV